MKFDDATMDFEGPVCDDCLNWNKIRASLCALHLQRNFFDPCIVHIILGYVRPLTSGIEFRRHWLRRELLGAPGTYSPFFNLFTYAGNGMAGNISDVEDIADRMVVLADGWTPTQGSAQAVVNK